MKSSDHSHSLLFPAVHVMDPDLVKNMCQLEGKFPIIPPLIPAVAKNREMEGKVPGLGNA